MEMVVKGLDNKLYTDGDIALEGQTLQVRSDGQWLQMDDTASYYEKTLAHRRGEAQAYLESLGIKDDINAILSEKYVEHLI